jgi:hypothetical protein
VAKSSWVLNRTGDARWEYTDSDIAWVLTYSDTSPNIVIQCYVGGQQYMTTFNGRPVFSGSINGWAIRVCAIGVNIAKEYTITTSGIELCDRPMDDPMVTGGTTMPPAPGSCAAWTPVIVRGLSQGSFNGTFTAALVSVAANGCGSYSTDVIAKATIGRRDAPAELVDWDVRIYIATTGASGISLSGPMHPAWLSNFPPPEEGCRGSLSTFTTAYGNCNESVTINNPNNTCNFPEIFRGNITRNGSMTITPVHDDNWKPPT